MIKGVLLAWLLCGKGGVVSGVVGLLGSVGLGDYRKEGGRRNSKPMAKMQSLCMTYLNDMQRCFTA